MLAGTYTVTETDAHGNFQYFFLAMGASVHGWKFCRPVISVDETFLKGKSHGTLLLATAQDGDNHLFPLAFSIVDSENDKSWHWFMTHLRVVYGVRDGLVIVSDRNTSIPKAIHAVFPEANYAVCMQHLWANVKAKFGKAYYGPLFYNCAKAYTKKDFDYWLAKMTESKPSMKQYLLDAKPELWSRSQFMGKRYNVMTTNISECLNSVMNEARGWPVACLVLSYRSLLQRWFNEKRQLIPRMLSGLTEHAFGILFNSEDDARTMEVCFRTNIIVNMWKLVLIIVF